MGSVYFTAVKLQKIVYIYYNNLITKLFIYFRSYGEVVITSGFDPEVRGSIPRMTCRLP